MKMYDGFSDVNKSPAPGPNRRLWSFVDVETSGYTKTGVEGRDYLDELLRFMGILMEEAVFTFRANPVTKQVAVTFGKAGAPGQGAFQRTDKGYTFHMGGVFEQYPNLRPVTPIKCKMFWGPDRKALIINLATGTAIVRRHRKKSTTTKPEGEGEGENEE